MFGGNFSESDSLFIDNYGFMGGTMSTTELAYARIYNSLFINQTTYAMGFIIIF